MISINATLFIQIIHFLILVFILNRLLFRPIMRIISERANHMENEKKQLNNIEEETKELVKKCMSIERETRKKAGEENSRFRREANETAEKIFSDTKEEISAIRDKADREIDKKIQDAQQAMKDEAAFLAGELIEKVIGRRFAN